jgi:hypothetical protein
MSGLSFKLIILIILVLVAINLSKNVEIKIDLHKESSEICHFIEDNTDFVVAIIDVDLESKDYLCIFDHRYAPKSLNLNREQVHLFRRKIKEGRM